MTDEPRRDPESLLAAARAAESGPGRGELRVYLGMCPGVGKTYAMLDEARRLGRLRGGVVVGLVETHGRPETEALLADLEIMPRRPVEHRGITLTELDLDAALGRQPALILVDELAHTNVPGSAHPKRWQDVRDLLDAGIDVWTTVNIQHVESLRDAVAQITGIRVQETVPDSFFDLADEIRIVDITPEQLRERLREGKVYLGERAQAAADGFFREGNLTALREMALRFTAQRVDCELRDYMRRHLIVGPWRSGERLLVAVGTSPFSERLIRLTRRLAATLQASWLAVHVETGEQPSEAERARLAANLALARALGGEVVSIAREDAAAGILDTARRENVTQIVAGKPVGLSWRERLGRRSIADRLARGSGDIDVLLVHPTGEAVAGSGRGEKGQTPARAREWLIAAGMLALTTAAGLLCQRWIGYRSVPMLYLLMVTFSGLLLHRWPVLALAAGSSIAWNFFFTEPRMTFAMFDREDVFLLVTFLTVAVSLGHLTTRLRRRERASHEDEERARVLYQLTRVMAASVDFEQAAGLALRQIREVFSAQPVLLLGDEVGRLERFGGAEIDERELSVCVWAYEHQQPAGRFTDTLPETGIMAAPLVAMGQSLGVLALRPRDDSLRSPLRRDLLEAFAAHMTVLVEKERLMRATREARVQAASQKLQRALLDQVSHELKTPVAVIQAAVERLPVDAAEPALTGEIRQATARLNRVVTQLVTLSRVEAGLIRPQFEVCDARDLLGEIVGDLGAAAGRVRIECEPFEFRADPGLLHTAIGNLLNNALLYSPADSPVLLKARLDAAGGARFEVTDAGPGIPEEERARLFERFARGSAARPGGMGLGLSIARHFVEAMGGAIEIGAGGGPGSTFAISLPRALIEVPANSHP